MSPHASVADRAAKIVARIDFNRVDTLVFLRHDGVADSVPTYSPRATALSGASSRLKLVGVYSPGVTTHALAEDIREAMK